ncbi:hypothetical protein [Thaumasiovibrio sp. DFM-14]|uniref:hypothetical protein n=1 Tax=Thaumasiovibrio sp. DFM-14 TaxID=3384792 RepID=UPI0039A2297D
MDRSISNTCQFNYSDFLFYAAKDKADFSAVLKELFTVPHHQDFFSKALHKLSLSYSDTDNIIRLVELARKKGINSLDVILPYAFEEDQIQIIQKEAHCTVDNHVDWQDSLSISVLG